jgi:hypothetical protein
MTWDPDLVHGALGILGTAVGIFGWATRRMVSNFDVVTANNTLQTKLLSDLVGVVQRVETGVESLKKLVMDDRITAATKAQETANAAMGAAFDMLTGKKVARPVQISEEDAEPEAAPPTARRRAGSRPG